MFSGHRSHSGWDSFVSLFVIVAIGGAALYFWRSSDPNFHVVVPGRVYRSAQPSPTQLLKYKEKYDLATVVNLRGEAKEKGWYIAEVKGAEESGLQMVDLRFSNSQLVPAAEIRRLVEVLSGEHGAVLLHGEDGAGGTSLASAIARIVANHSLQEARYEFGWRFGDFGLGEGSHLPNLLDLYSRWLLAKDRPHSADSFKAWIGGVDTLYYFGARIEVLNFYSRWMMGKNVDFDVTVTNTSRVSWPGDELPMHLQFVAKKLPDGLKQSYAVDFPDEKLPPGESWDVTVTLDPLPSPGEYRLFADIADGRGMLFSEMGDFGWEADVEVEPSSEDEAIPVHYSEE